MKQNSHITMQRRKTLRTGFAMALAAACMLAAPSVTPADSPAVDRVTVVITADKAAIDRIVAAARSSGIPTSPAGALMIPINIIRTLAMNALFEKIGTWLKNSQICNTFDKWAAGKRPGETGTITIEFILVAPGESPTPTSPRIVVPMFAKKTSDAGLRAGKGGGTGYVAPLGPGGNPTMKLDLFGNGEYVIERMECPLR